MIINNENYKYELKEKYYEIEIVILYFYIVLIILYFIVNEWIYFKYIYKGVFLIFKNEEDWFL